MLKFRAISFPLLLALFALMIFWKAGGPYIFAVVATGAVALLTYELMKMLEKLGIPGMPRTAAVAAGVTVAAMILRVVMKSEQPDIAVAGEAGNGTDALKLFPEGTNGEMAFRCVRYAMIVFVEFGVYPMLFRHTKKWFEK